MNFQKSNKIEQYCQKMEKVNKGSSINDVIPEKEGGGQKFSILGDFQGTKGATNN